MSDADTAGAVMDAIVGNRDLVELGVELGKLYTDHGFPVDMSLKEMEKRRGLNKRKGRR